MPTRGLINPELLTDIADAIRAKNGTSAGMTPAQMAEAISNLELSEAIKQALLNCFAHVAWIDDQGQTYYDALEDALYPTAPPAELLSISAVFEQGQTVIYDTDSLDDLKPMLTVTAHYSDSTSAEVTTYTLSGELTEGTSTITVSYGGKTATFDVVVSIGLDSIAFGSLTYRDIFITNNLASWFGNFENSFNPSDNYTYKESSSPYTSGYRWSPTSGVQHPSISSIVSNSPTHSVDASTASDITKYINGYITPTFGVDYIVAFAGNVSRYVSGSLQLQVFGNSSKIIRAKATEVTNGWVPVVAIDSLLKASGDTATINFGCMTVSSEVDLDGYMDDLVITPCPSGMTLEQATTAMRNFMEMVARGDN